CRRTATARRVAGRRAGRGPGGPRARAGAAWSSARRRRGAPPGRSRRRRAGPPRSAGGRPPAPARGAGRAARAPARGGGGSARGAELDPPEEVADERVAGVLRAQEGENVDVLRQPVEDLLRLTGERVAPLRSEVEPERAPVEDRLAEEENADQRRHREHDPEP